eukprot:TRINITY_DN15617_c0_g1_i1.p1 TRINITY_DN15617_c0_g1~~TRINITY_DN15617_c0_g1_i1.p1  ORF type:complete len:314 (-),score=142.98 TRINITY_DN15617_c0_g1_i1:415-1356(-)
MAAPAQLAPPPEPTNKKEPLVVSFTTAGLGGIMAWVIVHPFNTLAVRMNLASLKAGAGQAPPQSFPKFAADIVKNEGTMSLYKGLSAGVTRQIFYATSRFGLFEVFRDELAKYRKTDIWSRLAVGVASGGVAAYISCPAEVSLVRMSNDMSLPADQRRNYKSVVDAAFRIAREEGPAAFWRGSMPFVSRAMLVGATQIGTYDQFRDTYKKTLGLTGFSNVFAASMTSGLIYSLITMPFETAKNRMAFQKPDASGQLAYKTTLQTFRTIAAKEGALGLWKGFLPYYGRCGGHTVFMFVFVEQLRNVYQLWSGKQ